MTVHEILSAAALENLHGLSKEAAALHRDNVKLSEGVAAQAKIIRELRDEVSRLQADLDIQNYNVEFLKVQARRTRLKLRSSIKGRKQAEAEWRKWNGEAQRLADMVKDEQAANEKRRVDNRQLDHMVTNRNLEIVSLKAALQRSEEGNPLPLTMVTEPLPFKVRKYQTPFGTQTMTQINVQQCATSIMIAPEHIRDVEAHALVAQQAAKKMAVAMEQEILNALRGEPVDLQDVRKQLYTKMMNLRQQRQTVGVEGRIAGGRADFLVHDEIQTTAPSAEDVQKTPAFKRPSWMLHGDF